MAGKIAEQIREKNRLTRMRMGQEAPEYPELLAHPEVRIAMVPLSERETQAGMIYASSLNVPDNSAGINARNRAAVESDVWNSLRDPSNLDAKVFESIEDMVEELGPEEIDHLADHLTVLMDYASPSGDGLTDEVLDELKKASDKIEWRGLYGRRWAVVKLYLSVMSPELLMASLSGDGSTDSSTEKTENAESTSDVLPS